MKQDFNYSLYVDKSIQLEENMHTMRAYVIVLFLIYFQYIVAITTIRTVSSTAYHWKLKHSAQVCSGEKLEFGVQTSQDQKAFTNTLIRFQQYGTKQQSLKRNQGLWVWMPQIRVKRLQDYSTHFSAKVTATQRHPPPCISSLTVTLDGLINATAGCECGPD